MFRSLLALTVPLAAAVPLAHADDDGLPPSVRARAVRRAGAIAIDGRLDEASWREAPRHDGFTQRFPKDGARATVDTSFAIVYDDAAVYVGVWAADPEPHKIRRLLTRRDADVVADAVIVGIDSYHDRRTAYVFQLNAAGVQRDMLLFDDTQSDDTWDAVWTGDVAVGDAGWTAEFRIPLNQLRFSGREAHEWGLQVVRFVARTREEMSWARWPRSGGETVSKFGMVGGIDQLRPGRRLELLPYGTGGFRAIPVDDGDPINDPLAGRVNIGADLKYGLGSAFTLSATINPDFGQVEADPSQVNLSANELFFAEKRPFFLEGVDLFKIPIGNGDGNAEGVFYSRRIGAAPPYEPEDYDYIDQPTATTIFGAAKLTGKTAGWSIGWFDAITGEQHARIVTSDGTRSEPIVAPLTNYTMARVKRDLRGGLTTIAASATAVHRALDGTGLEDYLHDQAYTVGAQLSHRWDKNAWQLDLRTVASLVHGSAEAIARTQKLQRHLFQRPDAHAYHLDETRTSLTGGGFNWKVGRHGTTKHWRFLFGGDLRSPELELNDMGFQTQADRVIPFAWVQYHDEDPGDHVLNYQVSADYYLVGDELGLEPRLAEHGLECNSNVQFSNYWSGYLNCNLARGRWFSGALRGGPSLRLDPRTFLNVGLSTDSRRKVWFSVDAFGNRTPASDSGEFGFSVGATVQARSNIDVFVGPSYSSRDEALQYVDEVEDETGRPHYVFARIHQVVAAMTVRMNWTFSPRLSFQLYAQPFVATGRYRDFKDVDNPGARAYGERFARLEGANLMAVDDDTLAGTNGGRFTFDRPDFSFRQIRSTAVVRWEYRPGSSVFAIWSHGRTSDDVDGRFDLGRNVRALGSAEAENVVMVKANYWIGL